ncbi:MAG: hypothetical protein KC561_18325 [Myxococcales bacterium]|nr:hypothetical protein [Myxococcales bacterium]
MPAGESVEVGFAEITETVDVSTDGTLLWSPVILAPGEAYTAEIRTHPASAACTLGSNATGTIGTDNIVIDITCGPPCPCFDAADVADTFAQPNAVCLSDDDRFAAGTLSSGVYVDMGNNVFEIAGVAEDQNVTPSEFECAYGCEDTGAGSGTPATCGNRPVIEATLELTSSEVDSCRALLAEVCP